MCSYFKLYRHHVTELSDMKSVSLNTLLKPVSTMLATQRQSLWLFRLINKETGGHRKSLVTSQSWLKWEPSSSTVVLWIIVSQFAFPNDKADKNGKAMRSTIIPNCGAGARKQTQKISPIPWADRLVKFPFTTWCVRLVSSGDDEIFRYFLQMLISKQFHWKRWSHEPNDSRTQLWRNHERLSSRA